MSGVSALKLRLSCRVALWLLSQLKRCRTHRSEVGPGSDITAKKSRATRWRRDSRTSPVGIGVIFNIQLRGKLGPTSEYGRKAAKVKGHPLRTRSSWVGLKEASSSLVG